MELSQVVMELSKTLHSGSSWDGQDTPIYALFHTIEIKNTKNTIKSYKIYFFQMLQ